MKKRFLIFLFIFTVPLPSIAVFAGEYDALKAMLVTKIPIRMPGSMTGSEFAERIKSLGKLQREEAIQRQLTEGNLPGFLRDLKPVNFNQQLKDGKKTDLTIFVMPDYLSIGTDRDYLLIPMGLHTALAVADTFGFILPTKKIVDAIFRQSVYKLKPQPMPAGPLMRSTAYYTEHNRMIRDQRRSLGYQAGELISGHKKDIVISNRIFQRPGRIAIYGWHYPSGHPIQPLSTAHGAGYADYSHGIRLISEVVLHDGALKSIHDILQQPVLAGILSDEGIMPDTRRIAAMPDKHPISTAVSPALSDKPPSVN
ncbi:MAG: hypothetical protein PHN75_01335 [Syntrophales bacterium]|nr:hypothetical protein [Syntrophales bacterium]